MYQIKNPRYQSLTFETSVIIKRIRKQSSSLFLATLCRERYLTREEMKTQYKKAEKLKVKAISIILVSLS